MIPYQTKSKKLSGTSYGEVMRNAFAVYDEIKKKSKRRPYIRSTYFKKDKIFFDYFREHLFQKHPKERARRLKYFKAACELVRNSKLGPIEKIESFEKKEILYRFSGLTVEKDLFLCPNKRRQKKEKILYVVFSGDKIKNPRLTMWSVTSWPGSLALL